jgi:hypothetical protein
MRLPGQTEPVSSSLMQVVTEVEERTGRHVKFQALRSGAGILGSTIHDTINKVELISIPLDLPPWIAEVVAVHELMHSLQTAAGFWTPIHPKDIDPVLKESIGLLGSMIHDPLADRWAIAHGFDVKLAIRLRDLPGYLKFLRRQKGSEQGDADWQAGNVDVETLKWSVSYAGLRLRLTPLGLFDNDLDRLLEGFAPVSRRLGLQLVQIVNDKGCDTREQCKQF